MTLARQNKKLSEKVLRLIGQIEALQNGQPAHGLIDNVEGHYYVNQAKTALTTVADRLDKECQ